MEIFRPFALKQAKSRTLFIDPHERRMDGVEWIPFERPRVRGHRPWISTGGRSGQGPNTVTRQVCGNPREERARRRRGNAETHTEFVEQLDPEGREDRVVSNQEQNAPAGGQCFGWRRHRPAPRPQGDGKAEQGEVAMERGGDAAVSHDAERGRVERGYLSHGSGPP